MQIPKDRENSFHSSPNPPSSSSPDGPLKNFHQFKIKPRWPLKKVFIVHHPFILRSSPNGPLDQQRRQIHTSNRPSRSSPKALEDLFITVFQDQAQKPLEDPFITVIQDQASTVLEMCPKTNHMMILYGHFTC
ncbi:hypothetical protein ACFX2J_030337 [Malus domestica]